MFPGSSWNISDPQPSSESQVHRTSVSNSHTSGPGTSGLPPIPVIESQAVLENIKLSVQNKTADVVLQSMRAVETTSGLSPGINMNVTMAVPPQGIRVSETIGVLPKGTRASEKDNSQSWVLLCEFCDASFTSTGGLSLHKNSVHFKRKFVCAICDKRFTRKENLVNHMNAHNRNNVDCPFCHVHFVSKDIFDHICTEHKDQPFPFVEESQPKP